MAAVELERESVRRELERVLQSAGFARNERLCRFLRFVVERNLEGCPEDLKESLIGIHVFGRSPGFDTKLDPVVRTEARRLRARLGEYYAGAGTGAAVIIDLPKGGYVPVIRFSAPVAAAASSAPTTGPPAIRRWGIVPLAFGLVFVCLAAIGWIWLGGTRRRQPAGDSPAYDLYLRARAAEMQRALSGAELSIDLFEQAIAKDPSFAPAYAGLAAMEAARSAFDRFNPPERALMIAKGWAAAQKSMRLDSRLADAYDGLAMMQARDAQWQPAERSFRRAIAIAPSEPLWRNHFALFLLLPLGRIQDAIDQLGYAEALDPANKTTHNGLHRALRAIGKYDDADFQCRRATENNRQMSQCWAETYLRQGKNVEAIRVLETAWGDDLLNMGAESLGVVYARTGRREDAERIAANAPRTGSKALIFAALGDKDRTFEILAEWVPAGPTRIGRELIDPEFAFLRGDPRLSALRKKVGLPER
jgi:tetratricopeptide (TPR) repeat protein